MQGSPDQIEWYLARNGQQYGPLSDVEFRRGSPDYFLAMGMPMQRGRGWP